MQDDHATGVSCAVERGWPRSFYACCLGAGLSASAGGRGLRRPLAACVSAGSGSAGSDRGVAGPRIAPVK